MIYAERGNKVKQIAEDEIQKHVEQGYKILDDNGSVLYDTIPTDVQNLKLAFVKHMDEIKQLKARIAELEDQLSNKASDSPKPGRKKSEKVTDITE